MRELGVKSGIARGLGQLGEIALCKGDLSQAALLLDESSKLYRNLNDQYNAAVSLYLLGDVRRTQGDITEALTLYTESLSLAKEVESRMLIGWNFAGIAMIAADEGQPKRAALLFGVAEFWFGVNPRNAMTPSERTNYEQLLDRVHAQLGEEAFSVACAEGRAMTLEQALDLLELNTIPEVIPSVSLTPVNSTPPSTATYPDDLTAREVEVLRLIAQGWTDAQIATQMVISPRTVNTHLTSIYRKIQVSSRSAATRYAIEKKLI